MPQQPAAAGQAPSPCDVKPLHECLQRTNGDMEKLGQMAQPAAQPAEAPPQPFVSPPQPSSAGVQQPGGATWEDAAPLLARACEAMAPGELVQADSFSLFESVSAVEIGDPRMDAGADASCRTAEALVADGAAPRQLSNAQILAVMDRLAALEAAWHAGHFLPQSGYTCLYMLLPDRAGEMLPLAAYCKAVRATCNTVRSLALASNVCMDEDLMPHAFGLDVEDHFVTVGGSTKCLAALSLAEDRLAAGPRGAGASAAAGCKQGQNKGRASSAAAGKQQSAGQQQSAAPQQGQPQQSAEQQQHNSSEDVSLGPAFRAALLARLRFRRSFHQALEKLHGFAAQPDLDAAARHLVAAAGELQRCRNSAGLAAHDDTVASCFDASVNRRQMAPTPPRSMPVPSVADTWAHFEGLLARLQAVCRLGAVSSWRELQAFLRDFADKAPGSIERAALHIVLRGGKANSGGKPPAAAGPAWVPRPALLAAATGLPPGEICAEATTFLEQATIVAQNWCQAMCLNPARTRRRLKRLLEDWHNLGGHAALADGAPEVTAALDGAGWRWQGLGADDPQGLLGTWVEVETASAMLQHLLAGCPQQLYAPREFCSLYWYCDYLHGIMLEGCQALAAAAPQQQQRQQAQQNQKQQNQKQQQPQSQNQLPLQQQKAPASKRWGGVGAKSSKSAQLAEQQMAEEADRRAVMIIWLEAGRAACQGIFRAAAGATLAGALPEPAGAHASAVEQRFSQRFAAFQSVFRPEPLVYQRFADAMDISEVAPEHLFELAGEGLLKAHTQARALAASADSRLTPHEKAQLAGLQQMALRNAMALKILGQARQGGDMSLRLAWKFSHHPCFPVISVKR